MNIQTGKPSCKFKFHVSRWPGWSICQNDGTLEFNGKLYCPEHYGLLTGDNRAAFLLQLCGDILSLAEQGDYRNGVTFQGMDEGDILANRMLKEYKDALTKEMDDHCLRIPHSPDIRKGAKE
jgi:hypothetical protein